MTHVALPVAIHVNFTAASSTGSRIEPQQLREGERERDINIISLTDTVIMYTIFWSGPV
jgi:hypothetical protein